MHMHTNTHTQHRFGPDAVLGSASAPSTTFLAVCPLELLMETCMLTVSAREAHRQQPDSSE